MRHLNLDNQPMDMESMDTVAVATGDSCPNPESNVYSHTEISHLGIRALAQCTQLREINLNSCINFTASRVPRQTNRVSTPCSPLAVPSRRLTAQDFAIGPSGYSSRC